MVDNITKQSFRFDYGIETITDHETIRAVLPEDKTTIRPTKEAIAAGIDVLFKYPSLENFILSVIAPLLSEDDWIFPRQFRKGLKDIRKSIKTAGMRGESCFTDNSWKKTIGLLETNESLLTMLFIYQNTLFKA